MIRRTAELPEEFVQIANFANDKPGISMGFFAAFFGRETSAKEKKGQTCQIRTNSHFQPAGEEPGEHVDLTAFQRM